MIIGAETYSPLDDLHGVNRQNVILERRQTVAKRVVRTNNIMRQLNSFLSATKHSNSYQNGA